MEKNNPGRGEKGAREGREMGQGGERKGSGRGEEGAGISPFHF